MKLETFNFPARIGTTGDIEPVVRTTQFGDGYAQSTGDGINAEKESWPLVFLGVWDEIKPIVQFLREHKGYRSFKWKNPMFELGLYQAGKFSVQASGAYYSPFRYVYPRLPSIGQNMSIITDHQRLEPGSKVRLFVVDGTKFNGPELYFHSHTIPHSEDELEAAGDDPGKLLAKSIWWQGQEYKPWPVKIEGLEVTSDGSAPSPTLTVSNIDGTIASLCLYYQNMAKAKVTIRDTYAHYLDARNFPEGNPEADPSQEDIDVWYIDHKLNGNNKEIQFALSSPADLEGLMIPTRQIHGLCTWCMRGQYRGASCGYTGNKYFDADGNPTDDPSKDECSGLLSTGCEPRWGKGNPLPFGGFPGSALLKR